MNRAYELLGRVVVRLAWREYGLRIKLGAVVAAVAMGVAIYLLRRPPRPLPGPAPGSQAR